jgi:2-(1,2-epoxy-1,2-dihydrophenyl)acetyl-CoA isomerase
MASPDSEPLPDLQRVRDGAILLLTLDRPDARNAYSEAMVTSLVRALDEADRDDAVRCVILTGAGPAFSAGGDLKRMLQHDGMFAGGPSELRRRYVDGIQRIPRRFALAEKPVIAAINGPAIGAGLDLACMCDLRIAARGAQLGSTFVKVGLVPGDGGAYFLARTVGFSRALELMLTARLVDTDEAERIGLVHRVVEPAELLPTARALAEQLAALPPIALRLTKRAAYRSYDGDLEQALELAATYQGIAQNTADHGEAVRAMLERRTPGFTGA